MGGPGGSCEALWPALGKARVPGSAALLVPMVVEEKAPSAAVSGGLAAAAAVFMGLALS